MYTSNLNVYIECICFSLEKKRVEIICIGSGCIFVPTLHIISDIAGIQKHFQHSTVCNINMKRVKEEGNK